MDDADRLRRLRDPARLRARRVRRGDAARRLSGSFPTRVGNTVRRVAGPWTPAVHALLAAYEAAGISEAPRALGIDAAGREFLTYIDADMASPGSRLWDVAYLAYRIVPYAEDAHDYAPERDGSRAERLSELVDAYGIDVTHTEVLRVAALRLDELAAFTDQRAAETGRADLLEHAAMYRRDAARLREAGGQGASDG